ncbi:MAG TPA: hypothetical protein VE028_02785 [Nitratidesulfovibrio sp.]|nr:hypothetical protein [Nitratidesulfovibrio sp.]
MNSGRAAAGSLVPSGNPAFSGLRIPALPGALPGNRLTAAISPQKDSP